MDKATSSPASVDSVMAKAMMLINALDDSCEETTNPPFLKTVTALRAEVERLVVAQSAPTDYEAHQKNGLAWAVDCWAQEVKNRPLINAHRRTLDDTWRQVIRYFGGDPEKLIGPSHDALMSKGE